MHRHRGVNIHRFAEGLGIRVLPIEQAKEPRPPNVLYGGRLIARMLRRKGPDHTGLVLMCIQASAPSCLYADAILGVSRFLRSHRADGARGAVVAEFTQINVAALRDRAQRAASGRDGPMARRAEALAILIWNAVEKAEAA